MTTSAKQLKLGGIAVEVVRKEIKNLHLAVYPPEGRVRVAVPAKLSDEAVRLAVVTRLAWIRKQRAAFLGQDRQSEREMVTGESHYFEGRRYRLDVIEVEGRPSISLRGNRKMELRVRPGTGRDKRLEVLRRWYRCSLRDHIPSLVSKWEESIGVKVAHWTIRRMRTRWGTCDASARRVCVNLELAKKPPACLEYILAHEMVHFLERHHNDRFREHMDRLMPQWRTRRQELNRAPLAHEDWKY